MRMNCLGFLKRNTFRAISFNHCIHCIHSNKRVTSFFLNDSFYDWITFFLAFEVWHFSLISMIRSLNISTLFLLHRRNVLFTLRSHKAKGYSTNLSANQITALEYQNCRVVLWLIERAEGIGIYMDFTRRHKGFYLSSISLLGSANSKDSKY